MSTARVPMPASGPSWRPVLAWPFTRGGRWAAGLAGVVIVLLPILGALGAAGLTDWGWGARLALGLVGGASVATAISAGVVAVIAVVRSRERSIVLLGPLLFGAFWVMFVIGEFLSPH